jgi:hypothetical protein
MAFFSGVKLYFRAMKTRGKLMSASWLLSMLACLVLGACKQSPQVQAIDRGYAFLKTVQRANGAICDTINPLFDIWETVEAATAIWNCYGDASDPVLTKALQFLKTHENKDGLLCHNVKCRNSYCLETTSEYVILLASIDGKKSIQARMEVVKKLQKPSGQWEIGNPDVLEYKDFPSVTAFVLRALQSAEMAPLYPDAAWAWLMAQQNADGNWGATWEYYGCTAYALWPVLQALKAAGSPASKAAMHKAVAAIDRDQQASSYWDATVSSSPKQVSRALQTALVVNALLGVDNPMAREAAASGTDFLLAQQQPDGHWSGGNFPIPNARYNKSEYVFATAQAMVALHAQLGIQH